MDKGSSNTTKHHHQPTNSDYQAIVGTMPLYDSEQQFLSTMSYTAYIKPSKQTRPITFSWGGGPGYCALLNDFGFAGPMIYNLKTKRIEENALSWLEFTDLVFIDMVGSGWGRAAAKDKFEKLYCPSGDADAFCQFIQRFLTEHQRTSSPLYLFGGSYGALRAAIVAKNLLRATLPITGLILLSPLLNSNYSMADEFGNDMPYILAMPTFIRAALFHNKLSDEMQKNKDKTIEQGIDWAMNTYPNLLLKGDALSDAEKEALVQTLHRYTGLDSKTISRHHYRISLDTFNASLLGEKNVNYLDARISDHLLTDHYGYFIFTMSNLMEMQLAVYPHAMDYIANKLEFTHDQPYVVYVPPDDWHFDPAYRQVISILRDCLLIDEKLKLFFGLGYFDSDIPYMANITAINHLLLPAEIQNRVQVNCYEAGHLFDLNPALQRVLKDDIIRCFNDFS